MSVPKVCTFNQSGRATFSMRKRGICWRKWVGKAPQLAISLLMRVLEWREEEGEEEGAVTLVVTSSGDGPGMTSNLALGGNGKRPLFHVLLKGDQDLRESRGQSAIRKTRIRYSVVSSSSFSPRRLSKI